MNLLMDPIEKNDSTTPNKAGLIGFIFSLVSILGCGSLSVVGFIISLVGIQKKPRGLAIAGVCISITTGVAWIFAGVLIYNGVIAGIEMAKTPLAVEVWERTEWVAGKFGEEAFEENSGNVPISPQQFIGHETTFKATWKREGKDLLFTLAPIDLSGVEKDELSATLRVIPGGLVVADFATLKKIMAANTNTWNGYILGPISLVALNQIESDVNKISDWVTANAGKLPDENIVTDILPVCPRTTRMQNGGIVTITSLTYTRKSEQLFSLSIAVDEKFAQGNRSFSSTITFTRDGLVVDPVDALEEIGGL